LKKSLRKLKNRIISGLAAGIIFAGSMLTPMTVLADGINDEMQDNPQIVMDETLSESPVSEENFPSDENEGTEILDYTGDEDKTENGLSDECISGQSENENTGLQDTSETEVTSELESSSEENSEKESAKEGAAETKSVAPESSESDELHTVMSEKKDAVEVSILSSLDDSSVEVNKVNVTAEEGLEVLEGYVITQKEAEFDSKDTSSEAEKSSADSENERTSEDSCEENREETQEGIQEETLFVKAEPVEELDLLPKESMSLYSVENNEVKEILVEDIVEDSTPCEIDSNTTGIALVKDTGYRHLNMELNPDEQNTEKIITLDGMMPKDAYATVAEVEQTSGYEGGMVLASFDISIFDGTTEYQPGEERPVSVSICDERIVANSNLSLWHIKDDGSREEITGFEVEEGQISFKASGFSVYEIVNVTDKKLVESIDEFTGADFDSGFYLFYNTNNYFTNTVNENNALNKTTNFNQAAIWFFEKKNEGYILSTEISGFVYYLKQHPSNPEQIALTTNKEEATPFTITKDGDKQFIFKKSNENRYLQYLKDGIYLLTNTKDNSRKISAVYPPSQNDPYEIDGKNFGIIYQSGNVGYAFMADGSDLIMPSLGIRNQNETEIVYVSEDTDMTYWTFHATGNGKYKISTEINGSIKYLKLNNNVLEFVDDAAATVFSTATNAGKISFSSGNKAIIFNGTTKKISVGNSNNNSRWLNLAKNANLDDGTMAAYSANKVSISDETLVYDGCQVIVYTRVWDDINKMYLFYAIDHEGNLHPCYERGDNIMWVGGVINNLLWDFTEYHYDNGKPNYYYELQNAYSGKYLAPQIGQVLSDNKIGISLPGRKGEDYYSKILAWDDNYYSYAGIKPSDDGKTVLSCSKAKAEDFYFAIMEPVETTLTKVETISNSQYGIKMKMFDFEKPEDMDAVMGSNYKDFRPKETTPGILGTKLDNNGYPTTSANKSLQELFNDSGDSKVVDGLFIKSTYEATGYFEFDSCQNFATLLDENNQLTSKFTVYKELGTCENSSKNTLQHGQFFPYNSITAGNYSTKNPYNIYSALTIAGQNNTGKLPDDDPRKNERLLTVGSANYYNGMELEASFVQTPSGKDAWGHDIIFEFTGDDDFWLYVDGELVLDLGGIHSALAGNVNFATGDVKVNGTTTNLRALFQKNYVERYKAEKGVDPSETEIKDFLDTYFEEGKTTFKDYSSHTMKIFYMERGAGASNLHMRFNLTSVTPSSVILSKKVTGTEDLDFELVQYPYQIWYRLETDDEPRLLDTSNPLVGVFYQNSTQVVDYVASYTPPGSSTKYDSVFFLDPGKVAEIRFPDKTNRYSIIECGINSEVYDHVYVNDSEITGKVITSAGAEISRKSYETGWETVENRPRAAFNNHVNPDFLRTITFTKSVWFYDENGVDKELSAEMDSTTYDFRLYLSNGAEDKLTLAYMTPYYVKDPKGYICCWDAGQMKFVRFKDENGNEYQDFDSFKKSESDSEAVAEWKENIREKIIFHTSPNGSISKIPAGYSVAVPNIPAGTHFKIEERFSEIPLGYGRTEYDRVDGSFLFGNEENDGYIRKGDSPQMSIKNRRGWGIQANKIWSDKDYTSDHETVYTAVYVKNGEEEVLLDNTVRALEYPNTYVRYFIEKLADGKILSDYSIYEVSISNPNPKINSDGEVKEPGTVSRLTKIDGVETTSLNATSKDSGNTEKHDYAVSYSKGIPQESIAGLGVANTRTDTITNTRKGGVEITLYKMGTSTPLSGAKFTLEKKNGDTYDKVGQYVSDSNGKITILYDFIRNNDYRLVETASPSGYLGLPNPVVFQIDGDNQLTAGGNDTKWQNGYKASDTTNGIVAYLDVYNKPFTLKVFKYDGATNGAEIQGLESARFSLYKGVVGIGGAVKDKNALYSNMETDANGLISNIDSNLPAGIYYLTEEKQPDGYIGLNEDIIFEISSLGEIILKNRPLSTIYKVELDTRDYVDNREYYLNIPNTKEEINVTLTVNKTVTGNMGNKAKSFEFIFESDKTGEEYDYRKKESDGKISRGKIQSGENFTLSHNDEIIFSLPQNTTVTITETDYGSEGYVASYKLGTEDAVTGRSKKIEKIAKNSTLAFTNTREALVPTGVSMPIGGLAILIILISGGVITTIINKRRYKEEL